MKKGLVFGTFDLLHAGHCIFLSECRKNCDYLIVGLQSNPNNDRKEKNIPIQSMYERYIQLINNECVDEIIPYDNEHDVENMLVTIDFDIRFLDVFYEHDTDSIIGIETHEMLDIPIHYIDRGHDYSSSSLRNRIKNG